MGIPKSRKPVTHLKQFSLVHYVRRNLKNKRIVRIPFCITVYRSERRHTGIMGWGGVGKGFDLRLTGELPTKNSFNSIALGLFVPKTVSEFSYILALFKYSFAKTFSRCSLVHLTNNIKVLYFTSLTVTTLVFEGK